MQQSQLRQNLKFGLYNKLRVLQERFRLGNMGSNVFIDKRVELMRYVKNISIGDDVVLKEGARICSCNNGAFIKIGNRTTIGYHTFIFASKRIEIGEDCLIAPFVYIVDSDHQIALGKKINLQPNVTDQIQIGNDVWVASNVTILKGVKISDGAVIAANSVVNSNIPPNAIYGGSPARQIGERE